MNTSHIPCPIGNARDYQKSRRVNYFMHHWRGDLSLPVSFWLSGMGTIIILNALYGLYLYAFYLVRHDIDPLLVSPESYLFQLSAFDLFRLPVYAWLTIGIWRSASIRSERPGSHLWELASKLVCILLMAAVVYNEIIVDGPKIWTLVQYLGGDKEMGPHSVKVLPGGMVEYEGPITRGSAQDLRRALDANPARMVVLSSEGGRLGDAETMRRLITERGLNTFISRECLSACTLAFLYFPGMPVGLHPGIFGWP
jgi:hypothetical protein